MRNSVKKLISAVLIAALSLVLALTGVSAAESGYDFSNGLDSAMAEFMAARGLNSENFGMGFYNTVSGESWYYNADTWMTAGSMYKVPMNMVYVDQIAEGRRTADDFLGSYRLGTAMYRSIVFSDNSAAEALIDGMGTYPAGRRLMAKYSGLDASALPNSYLYDNDISPRYLVETLKYLYENSERYDELIGWMKQANEGHYFRKDAGEYEIAHKYGSWNGWLNDCGIIYTPEPYVLVVFHKGYNEQLLADLRDLTTAYVLSAQSSVKPLSKKTVDIYSGVQIYIDGVLLEPKDADGLPVDAFIYDGTTYLPARAISEALGREIAWEGETHTVSITTPSN